MMVSWLKTTSLLFFIVLFVVVGCGGAPTNQQPAAQQPATTDSSTTITHTIGLTDTTQTTNTMTTTSPMSATHRAQTPLPNLHGNTLRVASDTTYPPMEYVDSNTMQIVGFDIDLINAIGNLINATMIIQTYPNYETIFTALANDEFDLIISSASITAERQQVVAFSNPYLITGQVITVHTDNTTVTSLDDVATVQHVGIQAGTVGESLLFMVGVPETAIQRYDTIDLAFQDVVDGTIDAVVADGTIAAQYVAQFPDTIKVVDEPFATEHYAIAVQHHNTELQQAINAALAELRANGALQSLVEQWQLQAVARVP